MDILGSITSCIDLAERVWRVVQSYVGAEEDAANKHLFDYKQNIVRLSLLQSGLRHSISRFERKELETFKDAAMRLKRDLNDALEYLRTDNPGRRIQWALWKEKEAVERFKQIRRNMDILQGIVTLAKLTPDPRSLSLEDNPGKFNVLNQKYKVWVKNAPTAYSVAASWAPSDGSLYEAPREAVEVLVESYRPEKESRKEEDAATQKASQIAQKLWWTCENKSEFRDRVLPCIGFQAHRVIFLLPKNAKGITTVGGLIRRDDASESTTSVSIEVRYSLALQLAKAILRVHSAGLMHCAIRSDTILFLAPDEQKDNAPDKQEDNQELVIERNGQEGGDLGNALPLKREWRNRFRNLNLLKRGDTGSQSPNGEDDAASIRTGDRDQDAHPQMAIMSSSTTVGYVPPGFGNVYLMHWGSMHDRGDHFSIEHRSGFKKIYIHPEQQKRIPEQYNMGHDIYSIGVCLIEIGLWESLAQVKSRKLVYGGLAEKLGLGGEETLDAEQVKGRLVETAIKELPKAMGEGYAHIAKACLTCLDKRDGPNWNVDFKALDRQKDCEVFDERVVSFLARVHNAMTHL
ncbi:MAG: hypothetical protein Q9160_000685 [Pyrenula sp. 1 TL-2023]